jgi:hypothetical protein
MNTKTAETTSYADRWHDAINETYGEDGDWGLAENLTDTEFEQAIEKAAECLRYGRIHTFNGAEIDAIRCFMPAHEVHQSGAARFFLDNFGRPTTATEGFKASLDIKRLENLLILEERAHVPNIDRMRAAQREIARLYGRAEVQA